MSDEEYMQNFPEDDVPTNLNIQDLSAADWPAAFTAESFQDWLCEGRSNCEVAEALLHTWTHHLQTDQDCIADFFTGLLAEVEDGDKTGANRTHLPLNDLAKFVHKHCSLPFVLHGPSTEDHISMIMERIAEESAMVQAYLTVWRSSGSVNKPAHEHVESQLQSQLADIVYPWPEIKRTPTPERDEGRFAKAFPLKFTPAAAIYIRHEFATISPWPTGHSMFSGFTMAVR